MTKEEQQRSNGEATRAAKNKRGRPRIGDPRQPKGRARRDGTQGPVYATKSPPTMADMAMDYMKMQNPATKRLVKR